MTSAAPSETPWLPKFTYATYPLTTDELVVVKAEHGQLLKRWEHKGYDLVIVRGTSGLCAYLVLPLGHPYEGKDDNDIEYPDVHGGFTWSSFRDLGFQVYHPERYALGWDYSHYLDMTLMYFEPYMQQQPFIRDQEVHGVLWTVPMVEKELQQAADELISWTPYIRRPWARLGHPYGRQLVKAWWQDKLRVIKWSVAGWAHRTFESSNVRRQRLAWANGNVASSARLDEIMKQGESIFDDMRARREARQKRRAEGE